MRRECISLDGILGVEGERCDQGLLRGAIEEGGEFTVRYDEVGWED